MKTLISPALLIIWLLTVDVANAAATFTIEQVGADVRVTASGTINTTGLSLNNLGSGSGVIRPSDTWLIVGPSSTTPITNYDKYTGTITGPASFGTGGQVGATSMTAPASIAGFYGGSTSSEWGVYVPDGFVSGSSISGSSTYINQSLASLGLTAGQTYTWNLPNDTITVQILSIAPPPTPVNPIPTLNEWAQILMMLAMISAVGFYGWRIKR